METEDVVHVLRHVHPAVRPGGSLLDIHPLGIDMAVRAGSRGLGFVDTSEFALVVDAMNEAVEQVVSDGLLEEVRVLRRTVVERFDDAAEALEEADSWTNLRLPPAVRRGLERAEERPVEFVDTVRYRLFRTRSQAECRPDRRGGRGSLARPLSLLFCSGRTRAGQRPPALP